MVAETESLSALAHVLGATADAFAKLADAVAHMVTLGSKAYDFVAARRTHARLRDLDARLTYFLHDQGGGNAAIIIGLGTYISMLLDFTEPEESGREGYEEFLQKQWERFLETANATLGSASQLLETLRGERSDFVLDEVYSTIMESLSARAGVLTRLNATPAPKSNAQIASLEMVLAQYERLHANLAKAVAEMSRYLQGSER